MNTHSYVGVIDLNNRLDNSSIAKDIDVGIVNDRITLDMADFLKVFGDKTRIKMLLILLDKEICVNELAYEMDMSQTAISHQLRVLRQSRIVKFRKDGKKKFYSLDDDHVTNILKLAKEHISHR